jgi:hypothetical protein
MGGVLITKTLPNHLIIRGFDDEAGFALTASSIVSRLQTFIDNYLFIWLGILGIMMIALIATAKFDWYDKLNGHG